VCGASVIGTMWGLGFRRCERGSLRVLEALSLRCCKNVDTEQD
jgi:hypothetical protein